MNAGPTQGLVDADCCPLCGGPNHCQLGTRSLHQGSCWCFKVKVPEELLARVPAELRNKACICRACVTKYSPTAADGASLTIRLEDFYFEAGRMIFTAAYHRRRGYCCGNGCRHCPYPQPP